MIYIDFLMPVDFKDAPKTIKNKILHKTSIRHPYQISSPLLQNIPMSFFHFLNNNPIWKKHNFYQKLTTI